MIDPEEVARARPPKDKPVPRSESSLLQKLKSEALPYAHCAWCDDTPKTRSMLEEHCYAIHHVVLQPSRCEVCPSVSVPDYYGKGVAIATMEFWFLLH